MYILDPPRAMNNVGEDAPIGKGDSFSYYCNGKAMGERTLSEVLGSSATVLTFLRPIWVVGPRNRVTVASMRQTGMTDFDSRGLGGELLTWVWSVL